MTILAVIESTPEHIRAEPVLHDVPFPIIADPLHTLYTLYQAETSRIGLWQALRKRTVLLAEARHRGFDGLVKGQPRDQDGVLTRLPAEFLIGPTLHIERLHYGRDSGDYLPLTELDTWLTV